MENHCFDANFNHRRKNGRGRGGHVPTVGTYQPKFSLKYWFCIKSQNQEVLRLATNPKFGKYTAIVPMRMRSFVVAAPGRRRRKRDCQVVTSFGDTRTAARGPAGHHA